MLSQPDLTVLHKASHNVTGCLAFSALTCSHKCSLRFQFRWRVEKERLWRRVSLVQVSDSRGGKTASDMNNLTTMFHCEFETLCYLSVACSSPYIHLSDIHLKLGFISKQQAGYHRVTHNTIQSQYVALNNDSITLSNSANSQRAYRVVVCASLTQTASATCHFPCVPAMATKSFPFEKDLSV